MGYRLSAAYFSPAAYVYDSYKNNGYVATLLGKTQRDNTQASLSAQMDYEQYLRPAYERQLSDWHKNVPGREIRYPELSYPGKIRGVDTSVTSLGFNYANADASYYGGLPYRASGLYGIASKLSRTL